MGDNQVVVKKKKVLEVPLELIWDPNREDEEKENNTSGRGNNDGRSETLKENIDEDTDNVKSLDSRKKKDSKPGKSFFLKLRRRSVSKSEKIRQKSGEKITDAKNNQKNVQSSSKVQEDGKNTEVSNNLTKLTSSFPEEAEFLEYVDKLMIGLKLEECIEEDEVSDEREADIIDEDVSLSYIRDELHSVKEQEDALDRVAEILEPELRASMNATDDQRKKTSDQLLKDWFTVVAKRHNLLERKYQLLRALENGDHMELELRTDDVKQQLHILMKIPEHERTPEQRKRHEVLWRELIELVNKRDEIVQVEEEHRRLSSSSISDSSPVEESPPEKNSPKLNYKQRRLSFL